VDAATLMESVDYTPESVLEAEEERLALSGPLLAVCGLCGGAGTSTLAYLIARATARSDTEPVLVCDTGGPAAGLASYAGLESPRSLAAAADAIALGETLEEGLYASAGDGLRVIARGPDLDSEGDERALARLLADAREVHQLTVADCGTLARPADRRVVDVATHVAWVVPATVGGLQRGRRLIDLFPVHAGSELVVARRDGRSRRPPMSELAELADARGGPLVLVPHLPDLAEKRADLAIEEASVALEAIRGVLQR
jgi:Flp pilus assembly CpaE family ATPase